MSARSQLAGLLLFVPALVVSACGGVNPVRTHEAALEAAAMAARVAGEGGVQHRPFRSTLTGVSELLGPCEGGGLLLRDRGEGVATHLGASTMEMSGCMGMSETEIWSIGEGTGQYLAANGDTLRFKGIKARGDLLAGIARADFVIDGGSGRFQAATGEFSVVTMLRAGGEWTSETVSGWISY